MSFSLRVSVFAFPALALPVLLSACGRETLDEGRDGPAESESLDDGRVPGDTPRLPPLVSGIDYPELIDTLLSCGEICGAEAQLLFDLCSETQGERSCADIVSDELSECLSALCSEEAEEGREDEGQPDGQSGDSASGLTPGEPDSAGGRDDMQPGFGGQTDPGVDPQDDPKALCEAKAESAYARCLKQGGDQSICTPFGYSVFEACVDSQSGSGGSGGTPSDNVEACLEAVEEKVADCLQSGRGAEVCEKLAEDLESQCTEKDSGAAMSCSDKARSTFQTCRRQGSSVELCRDKAEEVRDLCEAKADPSNQPVAVCAEKCADQVMETVRQCRQARVSRSACAEKVEAIAEACAAKCAP